jgi:hypothetical protein
LWYASTKPAIQACIHRLPIRNDASRLSPIHPANMRIPPQTDSPNSLCRITCRKSQPLLGRTLKYVI